MKFYKLLRKKVMRFHRKRKSLNNSNNSSSRNSSNNSNSLKKKIIGREIKRNPISDNFDYIKKINIPVLN